MQNQLGGYKAGQDIALPDTVLMLQGWRIPLEEMFLCRKSLQGVWEGRGVNEGEAKEEDFFLSVNQNLSLGQIN